MAGGIAIKTNLNVVANNLLKKLNAIKTKEIVLRPVVFDAIELLTKRIHKDGKASDESAIGTYSKPYMKVRLKQLPATYTKGKNKGKPRLNYDHPKRLADTKVIASLTRQLENSYAVVDAPKGYAVGMLNEFAFKKIGWVEETYDKKIWKLTEKETEFLKGQIEKRVADELNK